MLDIAPADRSHLPFIARAQLAMALETEGLTLAPDTVHAGVGYMFDHPDRGFYLLALHRGSPCASMLVLKEWSDWRNGDVWWLHSVYVTPEHRREGVFRALFEAVQERALAASARGLRLYVDKTNARAQAVYRALGMTDEHYDLYEKML